MWDLVRLLFCMAGAVFGADPLCVECHFAWQAQYLGHYFTLYMPHTLHAPHSTLYTLHSTLLPQFYPLFGVGVGMHFLAWTTRVFFSCMVTASVVPRCFCPGRYMACVPFFFFHCVPYFFFQSLDECVWLTCFANHHPR